MSQTSSGYNVNKSVTTQSGASKDVNKDINTQEGTASRSSTATNAWGQSASRDRTATNEGGYASIEGSASTSTGRYASGEGVAGRNCVRPAGVRGHGQHEVQRQLRHRGRAQSVRRLDDRDGRARTAEESPRRFPPAIAPARTTAARDHTYGGSYYRPYSDGGVHYYYPVPPPYYAYYAEPACRGHDADGRGRGLPRLERRQLQQADDEQRRQGRVPVGAGAHGREAPGRCPPSASSSRSPARTYYLASNTFYRRVTEGAQEHFIVVTAPAGVVFVAALPADFTVVQLNTMYFRSGGRFYVPFLAADGKEMYVMVDTPPQPPAGAPAPAPVAPGRGESNDAGLSGTGLAHGGRTCRPCGPSRGRVAGRAAGDADPDARSPPT